MENKKKESDKKEKEKAEYEEGLKKTLIPLLFGALAGIICFLIFVSTPYLVSTNGGLKEDLDNGIVPENLINMFETKGTPLSENITITKEGNDKWLINDEEKKNTYIIKKDAEKLNIYSTPKSEDWLLIAILMILVQKFVYPFLHTSIKGAKDWIYISFMTVFCWFIFFTLLLMIFF
jgi:hypothetical protein